MSGRRPLEGGRWCFSVYVLKSTCCWLISASRVFSVLFFLFFLSSIVRMIYVPIHAHHSSSLVRSSCERTLLALVSSYTMFESNWLNQTAVNSHGSKQTGNIYVGINRTQLHLACEVGLDQRGTIGKNTDIKAATG